MFLKKEEVPIVEQWLNELINTLHLDRVLFLGINFYSLTSLGLLVKILSPKINPQWP